jgi:hypothetical protein
MLTDKPKRLINRAGKRPKLFTLGPDVTGGATAFGLVSWISDCSVDTMGRFS